jgi:drug/metabolite transporter (DMT)-like permease
MRAATLGWILLAQAIGGSTPALTKLALEGLGPWALVAVRQLLGAAFLLALARLGRGARGGAAAPPAAPWSGRDWILLLVLSWAGFALPQILNALGLERSTATNGALLSPLEPIGILIGGALLLGEPISGGRALAIALGIAGALLIVGPSAPADAPGDPRGDALMALGHLCWAIYTLAAKPLVARHDPLLISIRAAALSWIPLAPLALREPLAVERALPALGWILLLALLASGVAQFAWNRALRDVQAGTMAVFVFVQPLVGFAIGVLALGERTSASALAGAGLIVGGVALAALRVEEPPAPAPAPPEGRA